MAPVNSITAQDLVDQLHVADAQVLKTLHTAACAYSSEVLPQLAISLQCIDKATFMHCRFRFRELYSSPDIQISNQFRQRMADCLGLTFQTPKV